MIILLFIYIFILKICYIQRKTIYLTNLINNKIKIKLNRWILMCIMIKKKVKPQYNNKVIKK